MGEQTHRTKRDLQEIIRSNFRRIIESKGLTRSQLAEMYDCNASYISQLLGGFSQFTINTIERWAEVLGVDVLEFFYVPDAYRIEDEHTFIPLYNVTAAAGLCGIANGENVEIVDRFPFKRYWLEKKGYKGPRVRDLALIRARGESMEPTIYDNEIMLVDLGEQVRIPSAIKNGAIYVVRWGVTGDEISVKRVYLDWADRRAILKSDNELYRPREIDLREYERLQDFILARVIWVGKENI